MAKTESSKPRGRSGAKRTAAKSQRSSKRKWPKVLYPLEPTSIPRERIIAAVDKVIAERKAAEKAERLAARKRAAANRAR